MMKRKPILFFQCFLCITFYFNKIIVAQDYHFSNSLSNSFLNNQSYLHYLNKDMQFSFTQRNQYVTVPVNFNTTFFDTYFKPKKYVNTIIGAQILNDVAGDLKYNTFNFSIYASKLYKIDNSVFKNIAVSYLINYGRNFFNTAAIQVNEQYNGVQFNSALPTKEADLLNTRNIFSQNLGFTTNLKISDNSEFIVGANTRLFSITKNNLSNMRSLKINNRYTFFNELKHYFKSNWYGYISYQFSKQKTSIENLFLARISKKVETPNSVFVLSTGLGTRLGDDFITQVGFQKDNYLIAVIYDVNLNNSKSLTNKRGAFELFCSIFFNRKPQFKTYKKLCPVYI
jgi:hypothetical protein